MRLIVKGKEIMNRKIIIAFVISTLFLSCAKQERKCKEVSCSPFKTTLRCTHIKNQGMTETCWIYAFLACVETERMEHYNDSVNLSPMWLMRSLLMEQASENYLSQGALPISVRGVGPDAERLMREYGVVLWEAYCPDSVNSRELLERIHEEVNDAIRNRKRLNSLNKSLDKVLPYVPQNIRNGFFLKGIHYTHKQYSDSLLSGIGVKWLTSYSHHPYGEPYVIELSDNFRRHAIMNVEIDGFYSQVENALKERHPVFGEGKMPGNEKISMGNNVALLRQQAFESFQTTDQHSMAIVGLKQDEDGEISFICKNSWGQGWGMNGYCLMSKEEFLINTILVGIFDEEKKGKE